MKGKISNSFGKKMLLSLAAAALLGIGTSKAQVSFLVGVGGGPQFTNLSSNIGKYSGLLGFNGGVISELRFGKFLAIEYDALYSITGAKRSYSDSVNYFTEVVTTTYNTEDRFTYFQNHFLLKLNIPLGAKPILPYDDPNSGSSGLSFFGGVYQGVLMGYDRTGTIKTVYNDGNTKTEVTGGPSASAVKANGILPSDFGFTVGAGAFFALSDRLTLNADFRFSRSLSSIDGPVKSTPDLFETAPDPAVQQFYNNSGLILDGYYGHNKVTLDASDPIKSYYQYQPADIFHQVIGMQLGLKYKLFGS